MSRRGEGGGVCGHCGWMQSCADESVEGRGKEGVKVDLRRRLKEGCDIMNNREVHKKVRNTIRILSVAITPQSLKAKV